MILDPAEAFCDSFGIRLRRPDRDLLHELALAFSRLPYENITKLIKKHRFPPGEARRRLPAEVIQDHLARGTGGTCFALTTLFAAVLERLGFRCRPALCDMRHGPDSHCALIVELASGSHLIDPGYLVHEPIPICEQIPETIIAEGQRLQTSTTGAAGFDLYTYDTWRYRLKLEPVTEQRFLQLWDASFDWTMMNGVHVCATIPEGGYAYLHNHRLRLRSHTDKQTRNLRGNEPAALADRFGISPEVVAEAYQLVAAARAESRRRQERASG